MSRLDWRQTFIVAEVASFWSYMILWCYMYIWLPASGNHMGHIMAYFICWEHIGRLMIARYIYRLTTFDCKEIKQNLSDWAMRSCNYPWSRLSN
jgi:acyl-ACP thioesterase